MLRSLSLALVIGSALLVLLAGASGGLRSLAEPVDDARCHRDDGHDDPAGPSQGAVNRGDSKPAALFQARRSATRRTLLPGTQAAAHASQPLCALERQVSDLQAQLKERSQERLAARRPGTGAPGRRLLQQRQTAVQARHHHHHQAEVSARDGCTVAERPRIPPLSAGSAAQAAGPTQQQYSTDTALARLRAQQRQASTAQGVSAPPPVLRAQPPRQPQRELAPPQTYATRSAPMPPLAANLMTARQLLIYGRTEEARNLLVRLQTQLVLQPVAPDQPAAPGGGNVAATWIGDNPIARPRATPRAMQAISIAMGSPDVEQSDSGQGWQRYPSTPPGYVYSPNGQR